MRRSAGRGGVDSSGGGNSGGISQSDQIEATVDVYTVKFSVRGDDLVIPENAVYKWSFGDNTPVVEERAPEHTYAEAGTYPVSVAITGTSLDGTAFNRTFTTSVIIEEVTKEASNSYLYAEKNQDNPLQYSFFTPLTFSGVPSESVTYEWQYDTTIAGIPSEKNVFNHTYDIYGKTYNARVTARTGELTSSADVTITIPKPEVNLVCSSQGLSVTCYPEITLDGEKVDIPMDFEWDCGDNGEITVTSGTEPKTCFYQEGEGENKKTITVTGESEYINGTITDTEEVSISKLLNVAPLNCNLSAGSDRLTWACSINTTLKGQDGAKPTGKLEYQWHFGETAGEWTPLEEAQEGYHSKTYTYAKYRNIDSSPYKVQVKVKYTGDGYQEEGASSYTITIDAPTVQISQNPASNNKFERTFSVIWPDYTPAGDLTYIWDFGDKTRTEGDRTITHTYKANGEYEVKLEVKSKDGVFVDGFVKPVTLLLDINENLDVPTGPNAIKKTQHKDNPLIWDFKIDGVSSTTGEIVYQWKKDGQVIGTNSSELKNIELEKFGQSYPITVDVSIKNTNIKKTVSTSVIVNPPVVEIVLPKGNIVAGTAATFDNTILYNGQDARKWLKDIKYQWTIDNTNFATQQATKTWPEPGDGKKADMKGFYEELGSIMDMVRDQLLERFELQCSKKVYNFPFLLGQGVWIDSKGLKPNSRLKPVLKDSKNLKPNSRLKPVLKNGTLTIGFIGLAECLKALTGYHHGEDEKARKLGLEIIKFMRDKCDEYVEQYKLNFSLIATPAEGLSGRFTRIDQSIYGIIPGVTDREYYTNSFHVPVYYNISVADKLKIEGKYHKYTNGGHISYIELDGDTANNLEAFEAIVRLMHDNDIGYGAINHPVDRDPICGYTGVINDVCPGCGRREAEGVTVERVKNASLSYYGN